MIKWITLIAIASSCQLGHYKKETFPPDKATKLCFLGDVGRDSPVQAQVAKALVGEKCHSIYFTGDIIYPGGLSGPNDKEAEEKFFKYYRPLTKIDHRPKLHIALGNHDYHNDPDVWTVIAQQDETVYAPARYYFQEIAPLCIAVFDTYPLRFNYQFFRNRGQINWIQEQKKSLEKCKLKIAVGHHPYKNSKTERGGATGKLKSFLEEYVLGEFDYYIAGHDHVMSYEGKVKGTDLYISGAGGRPHLGYRPGYMTMTLESKDGKLSVLTMVKEITEEGKILEVKEDLDQSY